MRASFLAIAALLCCRTLCTAQTVGTWHINGPVPFPTNVTSQVNGMGRVSQIKFHQSNPARMYAVSASGGLFISNDTGNTWTVTPGTETMIKTSCSAVCIDYTDDNIIYLSTGDQNYYSQNYGIWKSTDGGNTFNPANTGIGNRMAVDIVMDPLNHSTLVAATNNGIWRTTDGAATWTQTQVGPFKNMKMRPGSNKVLYAATDTLFYLSTDMGVTWTNITSGVTPPVSNKGMRIGVTPADTNLVFLGTTGGYGQILKSTDGGHNFTNIYSSTTQCIVCYDSLITSGSQGNYNYNLTVNPSDPNELLVASHCVWRSTDGGYTWHKKTKWWLNLHTDMHEIMFDPHDLTKRFEANDGGVWMSRDTAASVWSPLCNGLSCTEFYHSAQSADHLNLISAGAQDNGELYYDGIWKCNRGGDWTTRITIDHSAAQAVYYKNGKRRNLSPLGSDNSYNAPFVTTPDFNIEFPGMLPNTGFVATDSLWRSRNLNNAAPTWTFLFANGETIKAIEPCIADTNTLYIVTGSNHFIRTDNALATTPVFTVMPTPAASNVTASITTDRYNPNVVYLACNSKVYKSFNKGASWTDITGALPVSNIIKIIADKYSPNGRIFLSQASKVYWKDSTTAWTAPAGLPSVARISDMLIYNDSTTSSVLRVSTYGRGTWDLSINSATPPVGDFYANKQYMCPGDTIRYHKMVTSGIVTSVLWNFQGGTPATSTADSPLVYYATAGTYTSSLHLMGPSGIDTITRTGYIQVSNGVASSVTEGFEGAVFPPSVQWTQNSVSGRQWMRNDSTGGYGTSGKSIFFNNYVNNTNGAHDRILVPAIDLSHADSAYITFDVAYANRPVHCDSLIVLVSADCGKTFSRVYLKDCSSLNTAAATANYFKPNAAEWRTEKVSLTSYLGSKAQIAFENIGHNGQLVYIDNVNIHAHFNHSGISIQTPPGLRLFPNPTRNKVHVQCGELRGAKAYISCIDILGREIIREERQIINGTLDNAIDLSGFAAGTYIIQVSDESGYTVIGKIQLQ